MGKTRGAWLSALLTTSLWSGAALAQWQPDVRLTHDPSFSTTSFNGAKSLAVSGTVLHVVWSDDRDGNREIYYKRSLDEGAHWSADIRLTQSGSPSIFPAIAAAGDDVHVVWEEYRDGNGEIYAKHSSDGGASWQPETRLTVNAAKSLSPSVAAEGANVHVVWFDQRDGNNEIYYLRSIDAGASWGAASRLTVNPAASIYPAVAASGTVVHVVWEEHRDGNGEIYAKRSGDGGSSWGSDTRLTTNAAPSLSPAISSSGALVHVVWHDERDGNQEIYDKRSDDAGLSWGNDMRLTAASASSSFASVRVAAAAVHVVWFDERDGNTEIYYKRSFDRGASWASDVRLTTDGARSTDPVIDTTGSVVHILWTDARDNSPVYTGNYEIYYKRDPTGTPVMTPGAAPDGGEVPGAPLLLGKDETSGGLVLTWAASCSIAATDYAVYSGTLGDFASHVPQACSTSGLTTLTLAPDGGSRYFLVVPNDGTSEGSYGRDSAGVERPATALACFPQIAGACP